MTFEKLSPKQARIFKWPYNTTYKAIVCDGAVRSGKTVCMITSYVLWAMKTFRGANFGICGKTVASAERNIVKPLQEIADITAYFRVTYRGGDHVLIIENDTGRNYFYIFGGKDTSSYQLLQGITLSGVFFDEVALMPENFVNQGIARCLSVSEARYWFNCNPESPAHWFYQQWILDAGRQNALHIHFLMSDNPILSEKELREAEMRFTGVFYDRYILGIWTLAEGLIYPNYKEAIAEPPENAHFERYALSIDYGTLNAFACILWAKCGAVWYAIDGYYYSGRDTGIQKTDEEYGEEIDERFGQFSNDWEKLPIIIDPSAASFITLLKKKKRYRVIAADNAVLDGIRETGTAMYKGLIKISPKLKEWEKEAAGYVWDDNPFEDRPIKVNDHCLTGDTIVMTDKGEKPISEMVGTAGNVWSYNTDMGKPEIKPYHDCRCTRKDAEIVKIILADGREIKCTADHPILTESGYKQAAELTEEDRIIEVIIDDRIS